MAVFYVDQSTLSPECRVTVTAGFGDERCYPVSLEVCPNPVCLCRALTLSLWEPSPSEGEGAPDAELASVKIDISSHETREKKLVPQRGDAAVSKIDGRMLDDIADSIGSVEWDYFYRLFYATKGEITESMSPRELREHLGRIDMEPGEMVCYQELLPYAPSYTAEEGAARYLVFESFCIAPDCDCTETMVEFFPATANKEKLRCKRPAAIRFDYRRKLFRKFERKPILHNLAERLGKRLLTQKPEWIDHLERRHARLKEICN